MFPAFTIVDGIPALVIRPDSITILKDEEALEKYRNKAMDNFENIKKFI